MSLQNWFLLESGDTISPHWDTLVSVYSHWMWDRVLWVAAFPVVVLKMYSGNPALSLSRNSRHLPLCVSFASSEWTDSVQSRCEWQVHVCLTWLAEENRLRSLPPPFLSYLLSSIVYCPPTTFFTSSFFSFLASCFHFSWPSLPPSLCFYFSPFVLPLPLLFLISQLPISFPGIPSFLS